MTSAEHAEIKRLKAENRRLREDVEISRRRRLSSRESSTPATVDHGVHRRHESRGPRGRVDLPGAARAGLPGRRADLPGMAASRPTGGGPHRVRRGRDRRAAGHRGHPGRALRAPEDDSPAAPSRAGGGVLHRGPAHAGSGPERGPSGQAAPDHGPGQGRQPRRGPAGARLHRRGTQPGLGRGLHLCADLGRVRLRRVHRRRLRPRDRGLARCDRQATPTWS